MNVKSEMKSIDAIRREKKVKENMKLKNTDKEKRRSIEGMQRKNKMGAGIGIVGGKAIRKANNRKQIAIVKNSKSKSKRR